VFNCFTLNLASFSRFFYSFPYLREKSLVLRAPSLNHCGLRAHGGFRSLRLRFPVCFRSSEQFFSSPTNPPPGLFFSLFDAASREKSLFTLLQSPLFLQDWSSGCFLAFCFLVCQKSLRSPQSTNGFCFFVCRARWHGRHLSVSVFVS